MAEHSAIDRSSIVDSRSILAQDDWEGQRNVHREELDRIVVPYLNARSRGAKNPVMDFLFEYYWFRPSNLRRWSPGIGVRLCDDKRSLELDQKFLRHFDGYVEVDARTLHPKRRPSLGQAIDLLQSCSERLPSFGCHGLHEWAMVYKDADPRHAQLPLRLGSVETDAFVESQNIVCTHFDAFRFFTKEAAPLNKFELSRSTMIENEQPGCLHTNMDLYKWTFKFSPWVSSELLRESFFLAVDIRHVDMQASPYDLSSVEIEPICVETAAGRSEYRQKQATFADRAVPIRSKLIEQLSELQNLSDNQAAILNSPQ